MNSSEPSPPSQGTWKRALVVPAIPFTPLIICGMIDVKNGFDGWW